MSKAKPSVTGDVKGRYHEVFDNSLNLRKVWLAIAEGAAVIMNTNRIAQYDDDVVLEAELTALGQRAERMKIYSFCSVSFLGAVRVD